MTAVTDDAGLSDARAVVLRRLVTASENPTPPLLVASGPLEQVDPAIAAAFVTRAAAPERAATRTVGSALLLAALDAAGIVVAVVRGHVVLAVIAGLLFVVLVGIAGLNARSARPLDTAQRRVLADASRWQSAFDWAGRPTQRELVATAADAAGRITATKLWRTGWVDAARFDLRGRLQATDERAHAAAPDAPGWAALVQQVSTLVACADELERSDPSAVRLAELLAAIDR